MAIERVELPINSMVIFHSFLCVYRRVCQNSYRKWVIERVNSSIKHGDFPFMDGLWIESYEITI